MVQQHEWQTFGVAAAPDAAHAEAGSLVTEGGVRGPNSGHDPQIVFQLVGLVLVELVLLGLE
jgi:hypothetical protein